MQAGWVTVDPSLVDDGLFVAVWTTGAPWLLFVLLAVPLTAFLRRATPLPTRAWWSVSVAASMVPFVLVDLIGLPT